MTHSIVTIGKFSPMVSKSGKVSERAERTVRALNGASTGVVMALALHGSAGARKTAASGMDITTLENLLSLPVLDGSQWPDVYAHLADKFGYAIEGGRGKAACKGLLAYAQSKLNADKCVAEHDGVTDSKYKRMTDTQTLIDTCVSAVHRWELAAQQAADMAAASLTGDTVTT